MSKHGFQNPDLEPIWAEAQEHDLGIALHKYASDFPHSESHFPDTVDMVLDWKMPQSRKRSLLWDNALRFYKRANLS